MKKDIKYKGKYLTFVEVESDKKVKWELVERNNDTRAVVPIVYYDNNSVILIKEYRHPSNKYLLSFPAGLIDERETSVEAGLREFEEETGYKAASRRRKNYVHPAAYSSAGITNEKVIMIEYDLNELMPGSLAQDEVEEIQAIVVPLNKLYRYLIRIEATGQAALSSRLLAFAIGFEKARRLQQ